MARAADPAVEDVDEPERRRLDCPPTLGIESRVAYDLDGEVRRPPGVDSYDPLVLGPLAQACFHSDNIARRDGRAFPFVDRAWIGS